MAADCTDLPIALKAASDLRGLEIIKNVPCKSLDKANFKREMKELYSEDTGATHQGRTETIYKMVGFIPQEFDYARCYIDESGDAVGAFYHPKKKTVFLPSFAATSMDVLVHESTHALQDQHYNLAEMAEKANVTSDSALAFAAVIEGDAEIVQFHYINKYGKDDGENTSVEANGESEGDCQLPSALLFQLEFPYSWGKRYASTIELLGKQTIDEAYKNLPSTTTQILYPKYSLPKTLGENSLQKFHDSALKRLQTQPELKKASYNDTWGEYTLRCILRQYVGSKKAVLGAKGWMYDLVSLQEFQKEPNKYLMKMSSAWETEKDAEEFKKAFIESVSKRYGVSVNTQAKAVVFSTPSYPLIIVKQETKRVLVLVSDVDFYTPRD